MADSLKISERYLNGLYKKLNSEWEEQDLAFDGGRPWIENSLSLHYWDELQLGNYSDKSKNGSPSRYSARKKYADNEIPVSEPIEKVQSSAQQAMSQYEVKTDNTGVDRALHNDADGNGIDSYTWLTGEPLAALERNGIVYLGVMIPEFEVDEPTVQDIESGTVPDPVFFNINASQVLNWVESKGDIRNNGQFERVLYWAVTSVPDEETNYLKEQIVYVDVSRETITLYDDNFENPIERENPLGIVPIVRASIGRSLIKDGVRYSKTAIELGSLSNQNMRDSFFNFLITIGVDVNNNPDGQDGAKISSDSLISLPENGDMKFVSPDVSTSAETRERIDDLKKKFEQSVQQAHSNFARQGSTLGSGVAIKEVQNEQAQSVKFAMDTLLAKFKVVIHFALKGVGDAKEDFIMAFPSDYVFRSEKDNAEVALDYATFIDDAPSKETKKILNAKKLSFLLEGKSLQEAIKADNEAIDMGQMVPDLDEGETDTAEGL